MPQAFASALAAGVARIGIFKLQDTESDRQANPEPFGLVRMDGSRRPAFETAQVAMAQMAGVWGAERERWNEVGQIRLDQDGQSTTVLFARLPAPQTAQVVATGDSAEWVDQRGNRQTIRPQNGVYTVELPPAICSQSIGDYCMIGGETFYLVQAAQRVRPTATPTPTAAATSLPPATPSPAAVELAAATATAPDTEPTPPAATSAPTAAPTAPALPTTPLQDVDTAPTSFAGVWAIGLGAAILLLLVLVAGWQRFGRNRE
jgi:hypothetical protein